MRLKMRGSEGEMIDVLGRKGEYGGGVDTTCV